MNQRLSRWVAKWASSASIFREAIDGLERRTNTLGEPRSPSYFGISYSRTRWSRKVFQVSSRDEPVVLVEVGALVREDDVGVDLAP